MPLIEHLVAEAQHEAATTRRLLERLPADQLPWRPHPRASTLGILATHVATLPAQVAGLAMQDGVDVPVRPEAEGRTKAEILERFESALIAMSNRLAGVDDAAAMAPWPVRKNGQVLMMLPRIAVVRTFLLNHLYHHRGQLATYLRMLNVEVPSIYGASADEDPFA
ncbi:MAG TPA: DinB family protein [Vicinamibacterales bacterium]|nr:DinB family protein [Vicinamibacterales bacterium]